MVQLFFFPGILREFKPWRAFGDPMQSRIGYLHENSRVLGPTSMVIKVAMAINSLENGQ